MTPRVKVGFAAIGVAALALGAGYGAALWLRPAPPAPDTSQTAPADFTLVDLSGRARKFSEWRGRPLLLNFWATWCAPCREEIPLFIEKQRQHAATGLEVVGVAIDQRADVVEFVTRFGIPYPILLADDQTLDLMARYGNPIASLPYSVIFRPDGTIAYRKLGAFTPAELEKILKSLHRAVP